MGLALKLGVHPTSAQGWIEQYRALPRLYEMSKRRRRTSKRRGRVLRTLIALTGTLLWVAMIRYFLHLG